MRNVLETDTVPDLMEPMAGGPLTQAAAVVQTVETVAAMVVAVAVIEAVYPFRLSLER